MIKLHGGCTADDAHSSDGAVECRGHKFKYRTPVAKEGGGEGDWESNVAALQVRTACLL